MATYVVDGVRKEMPAEEYNKKVIDGQQVLADLQNQVPKSVKRSDAIYVLSDTDHPSYPGDDNHNLWERVNEVVDAITPKKTKDKTRATIEREMWRRDSPELATLAAAIPLTDSEVDALFIAAGQL